MPKVKNTTNKIDDSEDVVLTQTITTVLPCYKRNARGSFHILATQEQADRAVERGFIYVNLKNGTKKLVPVVSYGEVWDDETSGIPLCYVYTTSINESEPSKRRPSTPIFGEDELDEEF